MKLSANEKKRLLTKYGPWALITGASSGIGLELAEQLAQAGFNLVINARNAAVLTQIETRLKGQYKIDIKTLAADVSAPGAIEQIQQATANLQVNLLVVSAGFGTSGLFIKSELQQEINMLRVNCEALLGLTHYYGQKFAKQKRGGIILMSSMVAFQGVPFAANYAATKAYVQTLAEALAVELKANNVDVLAAAPGPVESGFGARSNMSMNMALKPADVGAPILMALGRQTTVLPGLLTKVLVYALRTVPRWAKIKIMENVMAGFTKHHAQ